MHESDFGISVVDESALEGNDAYVAPGLRYEHDAPVAAEAGDTDRETVIVGGASLEDLMGQLAGLK